MASPVMLAIDVVLGALIGPPGTAAELIIDRAEVGEWTPVVLDLALFCAMSSVRPTDTVDHARFARLMRHAQLAASSIREPGTAFTPPSPRPAPSTPNLRRQPRDPAPKRPHRLDTSPPPSYKNRLEPRGSNSVVECNLAKVDVEGSNPFSRSLFICFWGPNPKNVRSENLIN